MGVIHEPSPSLSSTHVFVSATRSFAVFQVSTGHGEEVNTDRSPMLLLRNRTMSIPNRCLHVGRVQPSGNKWGSHLTSPAERQQVGLSPNDQPGSGIAVWVLTVRGRSRSAALRLAPYTCPL